MKIIELCLKNEKNIEFDYSFMYWSDFGLEHEFVNSCGARLNFNFGCVSLTTQILLHPRLIMHILITGAATSPEILPIIWQVYNIGPCSATSKEIGIRSEQDSEQIYIPDPPLQPSPVKTGFKSWSKLN